MSIEPTKLDQARPYDVLHPPSDNNNNNNSNNNNNKRAYRKGKKEKGKEEKGYNQHVLEVENGVFTLQAIQYMGWLRCCLNFALLHSAILCIRGSRSSKHHPFQDTDIELASKEGRLEHESIVE